MFTLHPDRVEIRAEWLLRGHFDTRVLLTSLNSDYTTIRIRYKMLKHAILALAAGVGTVALANRWSLPTTTQAALTWLGCVLAVTGFVIAGLSARKVTFVRFLNKDGHPGLDIGRSGPQVAGFDAFVAKVRQRILSAR